MALVLNSIFVSAGDCKRDLTKLTPENRELAAFLDTLVGTYQLSGKEGCDKLAVELEERCDGNPKNWIYSSFSFYLYSDPLFDPDINHFGDTYGVVDYAFVSKYLHGSSNEKIYVYDQSVKIITHEGSGGGLQVGDRIMKINFDQNNSIESVDYKYTKSFIMTEVLKEYHCKVIN